MNVIDLTLSDVLQLTIGVSIVVIWVARLTEGVYQVMRVLKPIFAFLLVIGIVYKPFFIPCMTFTTLAMVGAVYAHVKVGDNIKKMLPAITLLVFCFIVFTCPSKWA